MMAGPFISDIPKALLLILLVSLPIPALATTILVMGDSLSAAHGLEQNQGWVSLLDNRLRQQCPDCSLINASISGETTAGGKSRVAGLLDRHSPNILILELGGNDGLRGLPITEMRANLGAIITAAQHHKTKVLLLGMRLPPNYGPAYTRKFHEVYQELAADYHVTLVPFLLAGLEGHRDLFQADDIHPVAAAQPILLDNVWPTLEKMLRQ